MHNKIAIIGGGIAGINMAMRCYLEGIDFIIFNEGIIENATLAAAGLINPIAGRRFESAWNYNQVYQECTTFYKKMEIILNESFFYQNNIHRVIHSEDEFRLLSKDLELKKLSNTVLKLEEGMPFDGLKPQFGHMTISASGYVQTQKLNSSFYKWAKENQFWIKKYIHYKDILLDNDQITIDDQLFTHLIFCDGFDGTKNPFFPDLNFSPVKGECLVLEIPDLPQEIVIYKGHYLVPYGGYKFIYGATYIWDSLTWEVTASGLKTLQSGLEELLNCPYTIIQQKAGIRPATTNRRPILVKSHVYPEKDIYMFNGLGTKGISLSPLMSQWMLDLIFKGIVPDFNGIK